MATATETRESIEAKVSRDGVARYMDEPAKIGRLLFDMGTANTQAALRIAFDLQNAAIQASRLMLDATNQANRQWLEQWTDLTQKSQEATAKLVAAGFDAVEAMAPKTRG